MSRMPEPVESERIMAQAQSMIDQAREGLAQSQQAWMALGLDGPRIAAAHHAGITRPASGWMALAMQATHPDAAAHDNTPTPLQHHETRRARKHRFMV